MALPAGIWHFARGSEPVKELTILSERLGLSLTLLQFDDMTGYQVEEEGELWDSYDQFIRPWGGR
ncbi:hypothetical protein ACFFMP_21095 [Pseudoroseomonas cervicalis]|uniref:hypothetical protein n=1 Tax=Teichococcus cervicalis TaxID=204525 RepID=UPI0002E7342B